MAAADLVDATKFAEEREALRKYGVMLKADHLECYKVRPDRAFEQRQVKPWEKTGDIMEEIPSLPRKFTLAKWANPDVKFEVKSGIAYITLNRPGENNSLNDGITQGIVDAAYHLQEHPEIRLAVLQAEGKMFSAGCSVGEPLSYQRPPTEAELAAGPPQGETIVGAAIAQTHNATSAKTFAKALYMLASVPQYLICCVQGSAIGGGVGFICLCDTVIATSKAYFALSEVKIGISPATISPYVVRKLGMASAQRLLCIGETIKPVQAVKYGLVQHLVSDKSEFPAAIQKIADLVQQCSPAAVVASKRALGMVMYQPLSESLLRFTAEEYARVRKSQEADTAIAGLASKKRPAWMESQLKVEGA